MQQPNPSVIVPRSAPSWGAVLGTGLIYGLGFSAPFTIFSVLVTWRSLGTSVNEWFEYLGIPIQWSAPVYITPMIGLLALGGALFGRRLGAAKTGAIALPVASIVGVLLTQPAEAFHGLQPWQTFAIFFPVMAALVLLAVMSFIARALRVPQPVKQALPAALVTWVVYLVVIFTLHPIPGWRVGGGSSAMVKVAMVGHIIAGTVGAAVSFRRLQAR